LLKPQSALSDQLLLREVRAAISALKKLTSPSPIQRIFAALVAVGLAGAPV
jgi:hypothetical protein